jgi:hypothetical protein
MAAKPLLAAAVTCERVLREVDGVITPVRLVDAFAVSASEGMPRLLVSMWILIVFKSGEARGSYSVSLVMRPPSGEAAPLGQSMPIELQGGAHGVSLAIELAVDAKEEGLYWIDVLLDQEHVTSMPVTLRRVVDGRESRHQSKKS